MGRSDEAKLEFEKIVEHPCVEPTSPIHTLAHLEMGRTLADAGEQEAAKREYERFLGLVKDADDRVPIVKAAKTEYLSISEA